MGGMSWEGKPARRAHSFPCRLQDSYDTVIASIYRWRIMRMRLKRSGYRWAVILVAVVVIGCARWSSSSPLAAEDSSVIAQSADYFPDQIGNEWHYRGQITEGPLQTIEHKFFSNVSSVTGTKSIKGMTVAVFHDTN